MFTALWCAAVPVVLCVLVYCLLEKKRARRISGLERDLKSCSEIIDQMAELQMDMYKRLSGNLGQIEERMLDLTVPSQDASLPLERRHQVLALARKGVAVDEIVRKLNVPRGEAELIVNLRKYGDAGVVRVSRSGESKTYAQASADDRRS